MKIPPSDLVLIDTCIWVGFFNRNQSAERITVDPLLDDEKQLGQALRAEKASIRR